MKKVDTATLKRLVGNARKLGLSRTLPKRVEKRLDPDGWHILSQPVTQHDGYVRCAFVLCKFLNEDGPIRGELDFTLDDWNAIPEMKKEPWNE